MKAVRRPLQLRRGRPSDCDRGMVTAELAAALPILVVVTWAALLALAVAQARVRCVDAAREAAIAVSLGDAALAQQRADAAAGRAVVVTAIDEGDLARVTVRMDVRLPGIPTDVHIVETSVATNQGAP